jgi:putative FmdB family regulatory protein
MPLYEYQCESCGTRVEKIQKFTDPPPASCAACGGDMRKLFSSPAIQFKGSGWYITDYAKKTAVEGTRSGEGKQNGSSTPDSSKSDSGKSDSSTSDSGKTESVRSDSGKSDSSGSTSTGSTPGVKS